MKVVIIGSGIAGMSLAYYLSEEKGLEIFVVDKGEIGGGMTARGAGLFTPCVIRGVEVPHILGSEKFYKKVREKSKNPWIFSRRGVLILARSERSKKFLSEMVKVWENYFPVSKNLSSSWFTKEILGEEYFYVFHENSGYVNPQAVCLELFTYLRKIGVKFVLYEDVVKVSYKNGRVEKVQTHKGTELMGDIFVFATGVWTREFFQEVLGLPIPLRNYRSQATWGIFDKFTFSIYDWDSGIYMVHERNSQFIIGNGTQIIDYSAYNFPHGVDNLFVEEISRELMEISPIFSDLKISQKGWSGLLDGTPDQFPLLGLYPGFENLILAVGFNGYGIIRGPGMMRVLSEFILKGAEIPQVFNIKRFENNMDLEFTPSPGFPSMKS